MSKNDENQRLARIYKASRLKSPYKEWSLAYRFWIFQNERMPLLLMALLSVILVAAVASLTSDTMEWSVVIIASGLSVLYMLQIRLADESKDFEHDNLYYPDRPVQRGLITLKELDLLKNLTIVLFLGVAAVSGSFAVVLMSFLQQAYSYLTRKEFFIRDWLRHHFLTYQLIHYIQLLILAWLILTVLVVEPLTVKSLHFVYIVLMIGMVEAARTIGGKDSAEADDRYSHRLGSSRALAIFIFLTVGVIAGQFVLIGVWSELTAWILPGLGLAAVILAARHYSSNPDSRNAKSMGAAALLMYLCSAGNIILIGS